MFGEAAAECQLRLAQPLDADTQQLVLENLQCLDTRRLAAAEHGGHGPPAPAASLSSPLPAHRDRPFRPRAVSDDSPAPPLLAVPHFDP